MADLSRDAEHANQTLSPIFDKEKEQNRLREAQLISEIGVQAGNIAATQGKIDATIASIIGSSGLDDSGKILAHAAVNAALAAAQGNNALVGATPRKNKERFSVIRGLAIK